MSDFMNRRTKGDKLNVEVTCPHCLETVMVAYCFGIGRVHLLDETEVDWADTLECPHCEHEFRRQLSLSVRKVKDKVTPIYRRAEIV